MTFGHRFMAPQAIRVRRFDDYAAALDRAKVVLDQDRRKDIILHDARDLAFAQGLALVEDEGLLEEVSGLVEWPVVLMGEFDETFLDIPGGDPRHHPREPEMLRASETFCLNARGEEHGELSNRFLLTASNLVAGDGGATIVGGNERVVRARLSDAKFFFETDKRVPLKTRLEKLKSIVFHEKLGTQYERVGVSRRSPDSLRMKLRVSSRRTRLSSSARRASPRPISSPRWSANSPNCRV